MAGQLSYSYQTPRGIAGSLYDISPYAIDSRMNAEEMPGVMKFGMGVVQGDTPGINVNVPTIDATPAEFEGIAMTGFTNQLNMQGELIVYPQATVGLLVWGRAWARVQEDLTIVYGDPLYLVTDGPDAGLFTNEETDNMAIKGRFIGGLGTGNIAPVEIYNQKSE